MKNKQRVRRVANKVNLTLGRVEPLTDNQEKMFNSEGHLVAHGAAGTGKTYVATYLALRSVLEHDEYKHVVYIRSAVPTRDMGFLPGTDKEKAEVYEAPYREICADLFDRGDAYEQMKFKQIIKFMTTSFIRGSTLNDAVIIVDECQNMSYHELDSIITRVGDNCRIMFCGDMMQAGDLRKEESGLRKFYDVLKRMNEFDFIDFQIEDVVRGPLVKSYLTAKYNSHESRNI